MGKFRIQKIEKRAKRLEREKQQRIKISLQTRPLLKTIPKSPSKKHPLENGILLFGKNKGEKVLSLLRSYEDSAYVLDYLAKSPDLPKSFRNQIDEILINSDPWGDQPVAYEDIDFTGLKVREVFEDEDDIPWSIILVLGLSLISGLYI